MGCAQHLNAPCFMPSLGAVASHIHIQFDDVNPDVDVQPPGNTLLASMPGGSIGIYAADGKWLAGLPRQEIDNLARSAIPSLLPGSSFATAVSGIVKRLLHDVKKRDCCSVFKSHCMLTDGIMAIMQSHLKFEAEWFGSALNHSPRICTYASVLAADLKFSSLGDAYTYVWTGAGWANPGLTTTNAIKAVRWATASCYSALPVFNAILVPKQPRGSALHACLAHPCVQLLASFPRTANYLTVPHILKQFCTQADGTVPSYAADVLVVANPAGLTKHWPARRATARRNLASALQQALNVNIEVYALADILQPLPAPPTMSAMVAAVNPTFHVEPTAQSGVVAAFTACIAEAPPALKLHAPSIVYTDGSKKDSSITAAWVHPQTQSSELLYLPGPSTLRSTALRGELLAIHAALHSPRFPLDEPLHLMTDSLTSLYLIAAYLVRPSHFRFHKHRWLVAAIAQQLVSRQAAVHISKVRAHIGVLGNSLADELASQGHDAMDIMPSSFSDPMDRGPAWLQCHMHGELQDLNDLKDHALSIAEAAYAESQCHRRESLRSKIFCKVQQAITDHGGWHAASIAMMWDSPRITDHMRTIALQVRYGTLVTGARLANWCPSGGVVSTCMLCSAPKDTIGHRLGACTAQAIKKQICARHGHAVNVIAAGIRQGAFAGHQMFVDAECHERYSSFPRTVLPLYQQTSRPDIVLIVGSGIGGLDSYIPVARRRDSVLHLVEVGYTMDFRVHEHMAVKIQQHSQLRSNLLSYGWGSVWIHAFIVGHTGIMCRVNAEILRDLGVPDVGIKAMLSSLAVESLQKSAAILSCFPKLPSRPDVDGQQPDISLGSMMPQADALTDAALAGGAAELRVVPTPAIPESQHSIAAATQAAGQSSSVAEARTPAMGTSISHQPSPQISPAPAADIRTASAGSPIQIVRKRMSHASGNLQQSPHSKKPRICPEPADICMAEGPPQSMLHAAHSVRDSSSGQPLQLAEHDAHLAARQLPTDSLCPENSTRILFDPGG